MQGIISLTDLELLLEGLFNRVLEPIVRMEKLIMTTIAEEAAAIDTLATNYTVLQQIVAEIEANYNALKSNPATVISPADQVLLDASFAKAQALNTQVVADTATATAPTLARAPPRLPRLPRLRRPLRSRPRPPRLSLRRPPRPSRR